MPFDSNPERVLQAYLLGPVEFEDALLLQRQLVYHVSGERGLSALVLCEHPPLITVGRQGSHTHILYEPDELKVRGWPVRWVNRGGGCLLHLPGQVAIYPVVPLRQFGLGVQDYLDRLHRVVLGVLDDFSVKGHTRPGRVGVWVGDRPVAGVGVAVRDWVAYYGAVLNVNPDLLPFRRVTSGAPGDRPMTSLSAERRGMPRVAQVRQRVVERFAEEFGFARTSVLFSHPLLSARAPAAGTRALR